MAVHKECALPRKDEKSDEPLQYKIMNNGNGAVVEIFTVRSPGGRREGVGCWESLSIVDAGRG